MIVGDFRLRRRSSSPSILTSGDRVENRPGNQIFAKDRNWGSRQIQWSKLHGGFASILDYNPRDNFVWLCCMADNFFSIAYSIPCHFPKKENFFGTISRCRFAIYLTNWQIEKILICQVMDLPKYGPKCIIGIFGFFQQLDFFVAYKKSTSSATTKVWRKRCPYAVFFSFTRWR